MAYIWECGVAECHACCFCCAGDSRAVLCRSGVAIPLTDDHKAAREDETVRIALMVCDLRFHKGFAFEAKRVCLEAVLERPLRERLHSVANNWWEQLTAVQAPSTGALFMQARVQSLGGEIMYWNGDRVMGVLAVSRAIGDHNLRPFVIAQPEVGLAVFPR